MILHYSILDDEEDLIKSSNQSSNPFNLAGVKKIWVMGPEFPISTDIPNMMKFLEFFDWDKIKEDNLNITFETFPGPVFNGFIKEYRDKINIISYMLIKFFYQANQDTFETFKLIYNYILPDKKEQYCFSVFYYKSSYNFKPSHQLSLNVYNKNNKTENNGIELTIIK